MSEINGLNLNRLNHPGKMSLFASGFVVGILFSFSFVYLRYLSTLPQGTFNASKEELACKITSCDTPVKISASTDTLISLLSEDQAKSSEHPEFGKVEFWNVFRSQKAREIESLTRSMLKSQDALYDSTPKDFIILSLLGKTLDQNIRTNHSAKILEYRQDALDKIVRLAADFSSSNKVPEKPDVQNH